MSLSLLPLEKPYLIIIVFLLLDSTGSDGKESARNAGDPGYMYIHIF